MDLFGDGFGGWMGVGFGECGYHCGVLVVD